MESEKLCCNRARLRDRVLLCTQAFPDLLDPCLRGCGLTVISRQRRQGLVDAGQRFGPFGSCRSLVLELRSETCEDFMAFCVDILSFGLDSSDKGSQVGRQGYQDVFLEIALMLG